MMWRNCLNYAEYIPGVCNIGRAEIALRRRIGWLGLALTIALWALIEFLPLSPPWCLLLFLTASVGSVGFIQAGMHFCAGFGLRSVLNFGPEVGKTDTVQQAEFRARDRRTAVRIFAYSALSGLLVTAAAWYLKQAAP